jgi:hypothetical protein
VGATVSPLIRDRFTLQSKVIPRAFTSGIGSAVFAFLGLAKGCEMGDRIGGCDTLPFAPSFPFTAQSPYIPTRGIVSSFKQFVSGQAKRVCGVAPR